MPKGQCHQNHICRLGVAEHAAAEVVRVSAHHAARKDQQLKDVVLFTGQIKCL